VIVDVPNVVPPVLGAVELDLDDLDPQVLADRLDADVLGREHAEAMNEPLCGGAGAMDPVTLHDASPPTWGPVRGR
jgi:hypothetical protein